MALLTTRLKVLAQKSKLKQDINIGFVWSTVELPSQKKKDKNAEPAARIHCSALNQNGAKISRPAIWT